MKMGVTKRSLTWILVVGVCMNAAYTHAWGSYVCELKEQGLQKIEEICSESATKMQSPLSVLEDKLERILDFVEEIKTAEDSWLHTTKRSGMVERDLSQHDDANKKEKKDVDRRERDQTRGQEDEDRNSREGEQTRTEDDYRQDRRERTYDRQNRRDRTYEGDRQNRRERTDADERQNRRERTDEDEDRRQDRDDDDSRKVPEEKEEEETGPKKGECSAQVMDSHETIGMFYMMSYQHGHCSNRNPIVDPIRYCLGYCTTKTFIERESGMWRQSNDCKSCQPTRFETLRIPLVCDDGFTFEKKFENVVDCSCRRCQPVGPKQRP